MKYITTVNDHQFEIEINDEVYVTVDGVQHQIDFQAVGNRPLYSLLIGGNSYEAYVEAAEDGWQVLHRGNLYHVQVEDERAQRLATMGGIRSSFVRGEYQLKAPMPGMVVEIPVEVGRTVSQGELLVILESMKMQNELGSPQAGRISQINVSENQAVNNEDPLLVVE